MKKTLAFTLIAAPLCLLVRLFSQIYIINADGYYSYSSIWGLALRYSLVAIFIVGAVWAFALLVGKNKQKADIKSGADGKGSAVLLLILSALLLFDSGMRLGQSIAIKKPDILGIATLLFAVYCATLSVLLFHKKPTGKATLILGFFPPLAVLCRAIVLFFDSFKTVNKSGTKLELLTVCMLALFITAFVISRTDALVTVKRFKAVCMLFCLVSFAYAIPGAYAIIKSGQLMQNISELLFIAQVIILQLLSLAALIRLTYYKPKQPEIPQTAPQPELDIFIDEIPEKQSEETEQ